MKRLRTFIAAFATTLILADSVTAMPVNSRISTRSTAFDEMIVKVKKKRGQQRRDGAVLLGRVDEIDAREGKKRRNRGRNNALDQMMGGILLGVTGGIIGGTMANPDGNRGYDVLQRQRGNGRNGHGNRNGGYASQNAGVGHSPGSGAEGASGKGGLTGSGGNADDYYAGAGAPGSKSGAGGFSNGSDGSSGNSGKASSGSAGSIGGKSGGYGGSPAQTGQSAEDDGFQDFSGEQQPKSGGRHRNADGWCPVDYTTPFPEPCVD